MIAATHPVTPEELMALLDGELPAERAQSVSAHFETCAECADIAARLREASGSLSTWTAQAPANPEFERLLVDEMRMLSAANDSRSRSGFHRLMSLRVPVAWGAGALVVLALVVLTVSSKRQMRPVASHSKTLVEVPINGTISIDNARTRDVVDLGPRYQSALAESVDTLQQRAESLQSEQEGKYRERPQNGPMIARTVSLSIIAKDFSGARVALDAILSQHHAYAASLAVNTQQNSARSLEASLRVPAAELGAVMAELRSLGRVQNERQSGEEVSQKHADVVARLKNSRETEIRLQDILRNRTGKISDVLAVEQEIARVRGEIEEMEAQQKNLEHRVDFASVDLNLSEEYKEQLGTPAPSISTRFHNALVKGIRSAQETVVDITLFCAEVGPSLVIWLVMLLPLGWFLWRRWRRTSHCAP